MSKKISRTSALSILCSSHIGLCASQPAESAERKGEQIDKESSKGPLLNESSTQGIDWPVDCIMLVNALISQIELEPTITW